MIVHSPRCRLFKRKRHNFQVWATDGEQFIDRADEDDTEEFMPGCRFVRQFKAADYLRAEQIAFGTLPPLDADIAELVLAVNDVPGIMTEHSCRGHREEDAEDGYILFYADGAHALNRFLRILSTVLYDEEDELNPHLELSMRCCLPRLAASDGELRMTMRMTAAQEPGPPSGAAYAWLAREIRKQLAVQGYACDPSCYRQGEQKRDEQSRRA